MKRLQRLWLRHFVYGCEGWFAFFVVKDPHAGAKHRYTVYRIDLRGSKDATVIGREMTLGAARALVRSEAESYR